MDAIQWNDPEKKRPKHGEEIIFVDPVGMYSGIFLTSGSGRIKIIGQSEMVDWDYIEMWIPYPKQFK